MTQEELIVKIQLSIVAGIERLLEEIGKREGIPMDIDGYYSGEELLAHYQTGERYDLIYLDIQMKGADGIQAAAGIRKLDEAAALIFISSYGEYMISLFRLDVYAFLHKPIDRAEFVETFHEIHTKIGKVEEELLKGTVPFLRVHQSYLVNYHSIRSRSRSEIVLVTGETIPISEERKKQFVEEYGKLMCQEVEG